TPLDRPDGATVLVNRGWVPVDRLDPATRAAGQPAGTVSVRGVARVPRPQAWMEPDNEPSANIWYWIDADAMAAHAGRPVAPVVVEAGEAENPGRLPVGGVTRVAIPNNHLQYVVTWYSLAAVLIAIYVTYHRRRPDAPR
ncbi:MAG TPA: SURF1 family cytochrome oxidase biogenesis protein, partial [Arenibaculum sp.]|nr:SURF1 family cytochrome oxidase biogenesis protein [Arenibaculum sp.]